jgi:hypothetical protein
VSLAADRGLTRAKFTFRVLSHIPPRGADRELTNQLEKLKDIVEKQHKSSEGSPQPRPPHTETSLLECALEIIGKSTTVYEETLAAESVARGQGAASRNMRVAEWISVLESMRRGQPLASVQDNHEAVDTSGDLSDDDFNIDLAEAALRTGTETFEEQDWYEADSLLQDALRLLQELSEQQRAFCDIFGLQYKLAVCTYHTREPADAEEALISLVQQSANSDEQQGYVYDATHLLSLLYIRMGKVDRAQSECEKALRGRRKLLGKQNDTSLESTALMAHIYILLNNHHRAKTILSMIPEARRDAITKVVEESLGTKVEHLDFSPRLTPSISEDSDQASYRTQSRLSVTSIALHMEDYSSSAVPAMISPGLAASPRQSPKPIPSHIVGSEDPTSSSSVEERFASRAMVKGGANEQYSLMSQSPAASPRQFPPHGSSWTEKADSQSVTVAPFPSTVERIEPGTTLSDRTRVYHPVGSQSPAASLRQLHQRAPSSSRKEVIYPAMVAPRLTAEERSKLIDSERKGMNRGGATNVEAPIAVSMSPGSPAEENETLEGQSLSRKEILDRIGCLPRDEIEDAVCGGDQSAFANLLNSKKEIWRSRLRKRVRPERVTALHFAVLFGEMDMARRLVDSCFNVNEIPWGYSTSYTPLKFAIGARQVAMVEFLIAKGAKPTVPESWSTLAGQLMNRSWLRKTMSEVEKEHVPGRIMAILRILLNHGLDVNAPVEISGARLLHQAVAFGTAQHRWDLDIHAAMTSFLCEKGASPFQANAEGKTPYDMALASGHQDLLLIFSRGSSVKELGVQVKDPVELSC